MNDNHGQPCYRLLFEDAVKVWIMSWDGWLQSRIAAHFDTNPGRVNEVLKEHRHKGSKEVAMRQYKRSA